MIFSKILFSPQANGSLIITNELVFTICVTILQTVCNVESTAIREVQNNVNIPGC